MADPKPENERWPKLEDQFNYAWNYYALVADQRLRTFHFYCLLLVGSIAGTSTAAAQQNASLLEVVGIASVVLGISFFLLDERSRYMIGLAKDAIKSVESTPAFLDDFKIMSLDDSSFVKHWHRKVIKFTVVIRALCVAQVLFGLVALKGAASIRSHDLAIPNTSEPKKENIGGTKQ